MVVATAQISVINRVFISPCELLLFFGLAHKLIAYALDSYDMLLANFLAQFTNVNIDGAIADNHFVAPHTSVYLLACEEFAGLRVKKLQQSKLLAWQDDSLAAFAYLVVLAVYLYGVALLDVRYALKDGLHATAQDIHLDGFVDVVVSTSIISLQLRLLATNGREEDNHHIFQRWRAS